MSFVACPDESIYANTGLNPGQLGPDSWRPDAETVVSLYGRISDSGGVLASETIEVLPTRWGTNRPVEDAVEPVDRAGALRRVESIAGGERVGSAHERILAPDLRDPVHSHEEEAQMAAKGEA